MEHSFNLAESFNINSPASKMKSNSDKIFSTKWAAENAKKALKGRAINKDRKRKYEFKFDNETDTIDEDLINAIHNFHTRDRIKFQKEQKGYTLTYGGGWF